MISHLPRSDNSFKCSREMLDAIEERIKQDDEIMVTQLTKMLGKRSFKILTRTVE